MVVTFLWDLFHVAHLLAYFSKKMLFYVILLHCYSNVWVASWGSGGWNEQRNWGHADTFPPFINLTC